MVRPCVIFVATFWLNMQFVSGQNINFTFPKFLDTSENLTLVGDAVLYYDAVTLNLAGVASAASRSPTCGKLMFKDKVRLLHTDPASNATMVASFSTAFTFSMAITTVYGFGSMPANMARCGGGGDGLVFVFSADNSSSGDPGGAMCTVRESQDGQLSNHMLGVEFDTFRNDYSPYLDPSNNHVGVNINSMNSTSVFNLCSNGARNCTYLVTDKDFSAWVDFHGENRTLEVRLANGSIHEGVDRPRKPIISTQLPDIEQVVLEEMYVGLAASGYTCRSAAQVKWWAFATTGMPELQPGARVATSAAEENCSSSSSRTQVVIASVVYAALSAVLLVVIVFIELRRRRHSVARPAPLRASCDPQGQGSLRILCEDSVNTELQEFSLKELAAATDGFNEERVVGSGGSGKVYRGRLGGLEVAVKRMKLADRDESELSAEISIMSRLRHWNLVLINGWCRQEDHLMIVYEYMPNGGLHRWLFSADLTLTWDKRYNILRGLAAALMYLHEEWVVHRGIKASNVLLDSDFNARLSDFGLARLIDHVIADNGYLAPELKVTKQSDVYSFGVLALEVACGRRRDANEFIRDFVWRAHESGEIVCAADEKLLQTFDTSEMKLVLTLGLLCCHPEPDDRPSMRLVNQCIIGEAAPPCLPPSRP